MKFKQVIGFDQRLLLGRGVDIRAINDLRSSAGSLTQSFYFSGLNIIRCYEGRYRIECRGWPVVFLEPGEVFVIYPDHVVTIDALGATNRITSLIFVGKNVVDYFNFLGCFDGMHCVTAPRNGSLAKLRELMSPKLYQTVSGHDTCLAYLSDIVVSIVEDARENGNAVVIDAIRQIRANLAKGIVRLQELCEALKVSRSYLHRVFRDAGLGSTAAFIKAEQLQRALWLLRNTDQPIVEIAKASGFISAAHFSTFIRKRVGRPPRELR